MSEHMTETEWAAKADAEGLLEALLHYGLGSADCEPGRLRSLLAEFETGGGLALLREVEDLVLARLDEVE